MTAEELANDFTRAILVLGLPSLENFANISSPIHSAVARTRKRLLIIILTTNIDNVPPSASWNGVQRLLSNAYIQANIISQKQDKVLMQIDILLRSVEVPMDEVIDDWDAIFYASGTERALIPNAWTSLASIHLSNDWPLSIGVPAASRDYESGSAEYPVVVLGGTFDHLHAGHKILLSMSAWIAKEKVIVGVTDDSLLVKKIHRELLEPIATRTESVQNFLQLFKPGLKYDVVPITDVYGPTGWDKNIQALVVSKETLAGADSIASLRAQKSLPPLKTFIIDVISASSDALQTGNPDTLRSAKLSSTFIRQWIHRQMDVASHVE